MLSNSRSLLIQGLIPYLGLGASFQLTALPLLSLFQLMFYTIARGFCWNLCHVISMLKTLFMLLHCLRVLKPLPPPTSGFLFYILLWACYPTGLQFLPCVSGWWNLCEILTVLPNFEKASLTPLPTPKGTLTKSPSQLLGHCIKLSFGCACLFCASPLLRYEVRKLGFDFPCSSGSCAAMIFLFSISLLA